MLEHACSAASADFVERHGFHVERGVAYLPTAFSATVGPTDGPFVGFLSEYDALPGLGHGCGHNLIAISGIGAGIGLAAVAAELGGRVAVFGTPAEEAIGGKVFMARAGLFDGLDAALGAHPTTIEAVCPTVEGSGMALACQELDIAFRGQAAHAAADPFNGVNALNALIEVFNGINALRQHVKSDARIHGVIVEGGQAANVVPDYARGSFMVRAATIAYMNELLGKVRAIAEGAALITGATLEWIITAPASADMITNYTLARAVKRGSDLARLELREAVAEEAAGSTDWGNVSYVAPSVETTFPILDGVCTWHSNEVVEAARSPMGYRNAVLVAKAMALAGLEVLRSEELRAEIRREFDERVPANGRELVLGVAAR
jgi:amidohydrolase